MISKQKVQKDLGNRLREIRESKGLSLRDIEAHDESIDSAQLSRFENGEKIPMIYTLYKLAAILKVNVRDFFPES
ncbi:MAG: helix-turn-helix transcriptional regulator [Cyclobacteriaceae bacterium]|nr:helix-turn-helix transcriptional regulator [Cyclobacteriaceae bacterium]